MAERKRLLLTGASGFLGAALLPTLKERYLVTPLSRHGAAGGVAIDLADAAAVSRTMAEIKPDIVVHTAALASVDACERDAAAAYRNNVAATAHIAAAGLDMTPAPKLVYISTDQLYDGAGPHREDEPPQPGNIYALTKLWAEDCARRLPGALVLRSNFVGLGAKTGQGLTGWLLEALAAKEPVTLFDDVLFNPLYVGDYGDLLVELIETEAEGVVNLGAAGDGLSKATFARELAARFGVPLDSATVGSVTQVKLAAKRPNDMRMSVDRLKQMLPRSRVPTVTEGLDRMQSDAAARSHVMPAKGQA